MLDHQFPIYFDGNTLLPLEQDMSKPPIQDFRFPSRAPSPGEMSSSSSGVDDEELYDSMEQFPALSLVTLRKHFEFWDPLPQDFFFLGGFLQLPTDRLSLHSGEFLDFSHFELEVKTHGRQGRFSRENIWDPSYIDYASTPIQAPGARHLARTRIKSFINFSPRVESTTGSLRVDFQIGLPQELFRTMRTRHLRLTARAIFLGWRRTSVVSTEVLEASPMTVSVSHLRMNDYFWGN